MKRKICVITATRAEYGLLHWLLRGLASEPMFDLQLVVSGAHLSPAHGLTWKEIEADGFHINRKFDMALMSDTPAAISHSMGLALTGFVDAFEQLRPDLIVLLGDRYEILMAASAAMLARIPVAHLHGGELTQGAIDDSIRHAVTKMSHLHFVANDEYRRRVIQLGEVPSSVFTVGGLGLDNLARIKLLSREALQADLAFEFQSKNLLITFHPTTLHKDQAAKEFGALLDALAEQTDTGLLFTLPNADPESRVIVKMIDAFVAQHPHAKAWSSLGQLRYLSCMNVVNAVVGNSSSGILEAPSLKVGTINIGSRQDGRLKASSIIDCPADRASIAQAFATLFSTEFQSQLPTTVNPYGPPGASSQVVHVLKKVEFSQLLKKHFYDLPVTDMNVSRSKT